MMAGEFVVKNGWSLGPRKLQEYELVYFPNASQTICCVNGVVYTLNQPCFIFTRPGEPHNYIFDPARATRHLFVHFTWSSPGIATAQGGANMSIPTFSPGTKLSLLPTLLQHILYLANVKPALWMQRCSKLLFAALGELEGAAQSSSEPDAVTNETMPSQIAQAIRYIEQHLHEALSVQQIADLCGWTHAHFTRVFSQHTGASPRAFILSRRIDRACQLLMQESCTIKEIAHRVGFQDEHYFSRTFVREKGITARQYREDFSDPRVQHLAPIEAYDTLYPLNRYFVCP
jgi:AraC-like DNA-binding protein